MAGANSVFTGDTLLTTPNNERSADDRMFEQLGLRGRPAFSAPYPAGGATSNEEAFAAAAAGATAREGGHSCKRRAAEEASERRANVAL